MEKGDLVRMKGSVHDAEDHVRSSYHSRRVAKHGRLYVFVRHNPGELVVLKSLATGAVITALEYWIEGADDGE